MKFLDGINAQPRVLAASAATIVPALPDLKRPDPGAVTALVGIGASEHAARSAAHVWRAQGLRAVCVPASEILSATPAPVGDYHVALSESGRSAETVAAMQHLPGPRLAITNVDDSPLGRTVDEVLLMGSGPDSPVYTTGYTATLQALGLLGEQWTGDSSDWAPLPDHVATTLEDARAAIPAMGEAFGRARIIDVVGSGASLASAGEGALLLREASRAHTAVHDTFSYLHGPMEPLDPQTACIIVGDDREIRLARDVSALGCRTLLITARTDVDNDDNLTVLRLPEMGSPLATAVLEILPIQVLGWELARGRGLAVDGFRYHQDDTKLD